MDSLCNYFNAVFGNAPLIGQREWDNAPHNRPEPEEIEVEGLVAITIAKRVKIKTTSYIDEGTECDEDGCPSRYIELLKDQVSTELKEAAEGELNDSSLKGYEIIDSSVEEYEEC